MNFGKSVKNIFHHLVILYSSNEELCLSFIIVRVKTLISLRGKICGGLRIKVILIPLKVTEKMRLTYRHACSCIMEGQ